MIKRCAITNERTPKENMSLLRAAGFPIRLGPLAENCPVVHNPWFIDTLMGALRELPGTVTLTTHHDEERWMIEWDRSKS